MKHDQQTATRRQFIGVLSDVHIAGPKGPSPDAYRKALLKFRDAHVDGVCITGDLAIWGRSRRWS